MCHPSEYEDPPPLPGVDRRDVVLNLPEGDAMPARLATPQTAVRGAALIVTDIFGANAFYRLIADRLAAAGIAALLPDIFFREGRLREPNRELAFERRALLDDERALRDLGMACDWLRERAAIADGRLGTVGFCLGGNLVFHLCVHRPDLATVAYYGFPAGLPAPKAAAPPIEIVAEMRGPLLAFWGDRDEKVGMQHVETFQGAILDTGLDYEQHIYPGAEHGFLAGLADEEHAEHRAATDSWRRTLAFFAEQLGKSGSGQVA